ncbi:MAG TPA: serine hydrolase domain-containing protein [Phototrophicaceae bacterium]|nr:serine hydrolase domain-containing protein [Phototrophicaceae bacterium]
MAIDLSAPEIQAAIALVDTQLERELRERRIPGISAGIVYDQALIWTHGYGYANLDKQIGADERTVYRVASITKLFTSTMMMILRDEGKLNLDDPIEKYLPDFKIRSGFPDAKPPTFRQVASHAAGLPREGDQEGWWDCDMPSSEELLASLATSEMYLPTMTEPKYSNLGIALMGYALSKIAGQPYDQFVQERILQPLGMIDSGFERDKYGDDHYATAYWRESDQLQLSPHWQEHGFRPAGGMYSTVSDIARFISLQFSEEPSGGSQILGGSTLREMHMPVNVANDFNSGFGIAFGIRRVANLKTIGHSGGLPGYTTNISLVPSLKLAMIVFTNTGTDPVTISTKALETLIPAFQHQAAPAPASSEQIAQWKPYMGRYAWMDDVIEIRMYHGQLTAMNPEEDSSTYIRLTPHSQHNFTMSGGSSNRELMRFVVDADGKITAMWLGGYPFVRKDED